jgi:hypothetical protein
MARGILAQGAVKRGRSNESGDGPGAARLTGRGAEGPDSGPVFQIEYLMQRRRALLSQAKALAEQRAAILMEVRYIETILDSS